MLVILIYGFVISLDSLVAHRRHGRQRRAFATRRNTGRAFFARIRRRIAGPSTSAGTLDLSGGPSPASWAIARLARCGACSLAADRVFGHATARACRRPV